MGGVEEVLQADGLLPSPHDISRARPMPRVVVFLQNLVNISFFQPSAYIRLKDLVEIDSLRKFSVRHS
jgi:hypothetical protein